ncbi:hypothetical protein EVAR_37158_1 [Eumeta japonica]|uniref:Uncharacterized protein n=1 Tax=Eumeta variegata TaxID=151549 RepID=A0A4C1WIG9_EUMVA|nr:hypothetical protein EVAR_37158_1 [Eumeta japonica]
MRRCVADLHKQESPPPCRIQISPPRPRSAYGRSANAPSTHSSAAAMEGRARAGGQRAPAARNHIVYTDHKGRNNDLARAEDELRDLVFDTGIHKIIVPTYGAMKVSAPRERASAAIVRALTGGKGESVRRTRGIS